MDVDFFTPGTSNYRRSYVAAGVGSKAFLADSDTITIDDGNEIGDNF